jgi:hypothetical protein
MTVTQDITLANNLEMAEMAHSELQMMSEELKETNRDLKTAKAKMQISSSSGQILSVTRKYEKMENNYQHTTICISQSLTELKAGLNSHSGTNEEFAAAAAELIDVKGNIVDAAIDI